MKCRLISTEVVRQAVRKDGVIETFFVIGNYKPVCPTPTITKVYKILQVIPAKNTIIHDPRNPKRYRTIPFYEFFKRTVNIVEQEFKLDGKYVRRLVAEQLKRS